MFGTFLHINLYTRPVKLHYEDLETIKSPTMFGTFLHINLYTRPV